MACHVFVYYRPADPADPAMVAAVTALMERVAQRTGVRGRWLRRRDTVPTWMEVYESVGDPERFLAVVTEAAEAVGLPARLAPAAVRHAEVFEDWVPCA